MNAADFEAFLKDAGNAYQIEEQGGDKVIYFRDRGFTFCGYPSESDPTFLYLANDVPLSDISPDPDRLQQVLRDVEDEYKVVKLRSFTQVSTESEPYFRVATEQFEPDVRSVGAIFWRSIDLMRDAGIECRRRLKAQSADNPAVADKTKFIADLEAALERGCGDASDGADPAAARIRNSLALVLDGEDGSGSAFCVASASDRSYFLTNAHVVGDFESVTIYRQSPSYQKMTGTVVAKGDPNEIDLAIVAVPVGQILPVAIAPKPPKRDMPIAIAGYARVQIWAAEEIGELYPASHLGRITAVKHDGSAILHDAVSRPGNSGGPLFDPVNAEVYGVQRGGWQSEEESLGVGQSAILSFLKQRKIPLARNMAR